MKVLMVSRWLWEERRRNGGKPGFFGELVHAVAAKGIDLAVLSQASDAGMAPQASPADGLNIHVFSREKRNPFLSPLDKLVKGWSGYRKAVTEAMVIRHFVKKHGPFDAIIAQCEEPDGLSCAIASFIGGFPPLVTCVHDLRYQFRAEGIRFIYKSSLGFVFRRSARVVANSAPTALWLQREYSVPEHKIGQCRIHLTTPFLSLATQNTSGIESAEKRILFLGALNHKKAPDIFLQAALQLVSELPDWKFVLVGPETSEDRSFREKFQQMMANPLLAQRVEAMGRLEPSAVMEQIRRARVVVCPSRIETFSRTTIEALALGRPVIVTETTGAAHWVQSTGAGSVVPPNDANALARAIRDWAAREKVPTFSTAITSELTVAHAADDLIGEVRAAVEERNPK